MTMGVSSTGNRWIIPFAVLCLSLLAVSCANNDFGHSRRRREVQRVKRGGAGTSMVVCYYTNWAEYRPGKAKFRPENIDVTLCTHLLYAFTKIENGVLKATESSDESTKRKKGMYQRFNDLKKKKSELKTLLSVGGGGKGSDPFSQVAATAQSRKTFIDNSISFLRKRNFDGLDVDWEFPKEADKEKFTLFLQELQKAYKEEASRTGKTKLILSAAVPAGKGDIDAGYDIPNVVKELDFVNVMTYDFNGAWQKWTGLNSPLYPLPSETGFKATLNQDWAIRYWLEKGAPANKLVMGLAFYGRSFTLSNPSNNGIGAPASGAGQAGEYTDEAGVLAYYEICQKVKSGWKSVYQDVQKGRYAYKDNQWVGYDDPQSIQAKVDYIKNKRLAGAMLWTMSFDDFNGEFCGHGSYPLLKKIATGLGVKN